MRFIIFRLAGVLLLLAAATARAGLFDGAVFVPGIPCPPPLALRAASVPLSGSHVYRFEGACYMLTQRAQLFGTIEAVFNPSTNKAYERTDLKLISDPTVVFRMNLVWSCVQDPFVSDHPDPRCNLVSGNAEGNIALNVAELRGPLTQGGTTLAAARALSPESNQRERSWCDNARLLSAQSAGRGRHYEIAARCYSSDRAGTVRSADTVLKGTWDPGSMGAVLAYDYDLGWRVTGSQKYRCDRDPWVRGSPPQCTYLGFTGNTMTLALVGVGLAAPASQETVMIKNLALVQHAMGLENDTNRFGGDYTSRVLASAEQCQSACAGEAQCKAWTWVKPGVQGPQAKCWLKNSVPVASKNNCCVSGVK
jgi:hypothetical protein